MTYICEGAHAQVGNSAWFHRMSLNREVAGDAVVWQVHVRLALPKKNIKAFARKRARR